jgi:hypothetical protein
MAVSTSWQLIRLGGEGDALDLAPATGSVPDATVPPPLSITSGPDGTIVSLYMRPG